MKQIFTITLICALFSALLSGWLRAQESPPTTAPTSMPVEGPHDPQLIQDPAIITHLIKAAAQLLEEKKLVPSSDLAANLKIPRAKLKLPDFKTQALKPDEIYAQRCKSVLILASVHDKPKVRVALASAFLLTADGVAATNYHVMAADHAGFLAMTRDGNVYPIKAVLAANPNLDVALIQLDGAGFTPLPVAQRAAVGDDVFVISHPVNCFWFYSRGMVARYGLIQRKGFLVDCLQITADYARGSSGGAILSDRGELVGMVSSTVSIYYGTDNGQQKDLQMVLKQCVTAQQIRSLIEP